MVLVHGYLHSSWTWRGTLAALPGQRVLVPDLPGHGWGDPQPGRGGFEGLADWLGAILDARGVERVRLAVGNSLGGAALLTLALREPARFGRLLLVAPLAAPFKLPGGLIRPLGARALRPLFQATAGQRWFLRHALNLTAYRRSGVDPETLRGFGHLRRREAHQVAVALARAFARDSRALAERLPGLQTPTTLVWGALDRVLPLGYGRRVARGLGVPLQVFEQCGHCPHEEQPARFEQLLRLELGRSR